VRNLLILVLGAVVVWLMMERNRLIEEATVAKNELSALQKKVEEVERQTGAKFISRPGTPIPVAVGHKGSWLDAHIEKGAKALSPGQEEKPR
jgi:hypothetical protein